MTMESQYNQKWHQNDCSEKNLEHNCYITVLQSKTKVAFGNTCNNYSNFYIFNRKLKYLSQIQVFHTALIIPLEYHVTLIKSTLLF